MPKPNASKLIDDYISKAQPFAFSLAPYFATMLLSTGSVGEGWGEGQQNKEVRRECFIDVT